MLGNIIHNKFPKITVGSIVVGIDVCILALNAWVNGAITALYGVVAIFLSGLICDYITEGPRSIKAVYIISDKYVEISEVIICDLHRGVTGLSAQGMFSNDEKKMLLVLISRRQMGELSNIVFSLDPNAFTFSTNCKDAIGNGFSKPTKFKKSSNLYRMLSGDKMEKVEKVFIPRKFDKTEEYKK